MVARLRDFLSDNPSDSRNLEDARSPADEGPLPGWVSHLLDQARADISRYLQGHARDVVAISYEPRPACFFDGDDPLALMRVLPSLLAFHAEPREPAAPLSELDPYTCNLRLWAIAGSSRAHVSTIFRLVPDQVRIVDIPWKALRAWMQGDQNDDPIGLVRAILEEQKRVLAASPGDDRAARIGAVGRTAINALRHHGRPELGGAIDLAMRSGVTEVAPLTSAIEAALASLANVVVSGDIEAEAVDRNSEAMVGAPAPARVLRVDEKKIDVLLNLASDLVVAKNSHALLASRIENELGRHTLARAVQQEHEAIERLSGEIHTAILQLRMVPVGQVLRLFPRLVRDMSQRLEKKAEFVTHGEATELDKTIADRLFEPLLHLLRNAIDHGIEGPAQRLAAGKAETATITVAASRIGDRFVLEVADDGRGIDPEVVRRKAIEGGTLPADDMRAMPVDQVINLIFAAGLSTATEVSDISGRGVGMNVVRTTIEQIGGRVSLSSAKGTGTTVRLDLPLSIAITRIMMVEIAGQVFGIPMDAVMETVRVPADRISRIKGNDGFVLRDQVVPICSLAELMDLPRSQRRVSDVRLLVLMELGGRIVGVEVEAIRDRLDVVLKPLQGLLAEAPGYVGTTLLGDGKVLLVLNIKEIL